jgi:drug/metabolite transporter (DMT)-like permease
MANGFPWYLCLPLAASLLFAVGFVVVKKASQAGAQTWAVTFVTNLWAALLFAGLWFFAGSGSLPWERIGQPIMVAGLYLVGQVCTFLALERGDVSVATPILSVKVFLVVVLLTLVAGEAVSARIWLAASAATLGVALIQRTGAASRHGSVVATVVCALLAALVFALFDVLVQRWAPGWGAGRFLPIVFGLAGVLSLSFLPWTRLRSLPPRGRRLLMFGSFLIALQSLLIVVAVARFGDAARVNVIYALRGIWAVALAWLFARWLGGGEMHLSRHTMAARLIGAILVATAVILAIVSGAR